MGESTIRRSDLSTGGEPGSSARPRVLIVEDEQLVGWSVVNALRRHDIDAVTVESAEDAYTHFLAKPFDLVITDQNLPQMSGCELAAMLKKIAPMVPVILISAIDFPSQAPCPMVDYFIEKPFNLAEMTSLVLSCLPHHGNAVSH